MSRILAGLVFAQGEATENVQRVGTTSAKDISGSMVRLHINTCKLIEIVTMGDGPSTNLPDTSRLEEALAEVVISCLEIGGQKRLSVPAAVVAKLDRNEKLSKLVKV